MSAFSTYLEVALLNHILQGGSMPYDAPNNVYVALHTESPGEDGTGLEVSGGSYERKVGNFLESTPDGSASNSDALVWTNMPATTVTHVGIWDAATEGNLLFHGALLENRDLSAGDPFTFNVGDLDLALD